MRQWIYFNMQRHGYLRLKGRGENMVAAREDKIRRARLIANTGGSLALRSTLVVSYMNLEDSPASEWILGW
jgi:hypothetical protein